MTRRIVFAEGASGGLFEPLDLVRPAFMLRSGAWTVAERWATLLEAQDIVAAVRPELSATVAEDTGWLVNAMPPETADDTWVIVGVVHPVDDGVWDDIALPVEIHWLRPDAQIIRLTRTMWERNRATLEDWIGAGGRGTCPVGPEGQGDALPVCAASGLWDLIAGLEEQLRFDDRLWRRRLGPSRGKGAAAPGSVIIGGEALWTGEDVHIGPQAVLDTTAGPIILDDGVRVEPLTHLEGPAYVGMGTVLLGGKFSGGTALGPGCKISGEWEASVAQGFANKAHAGFFGHGILGEWVNLGAMTTNSDLKNTYGTVRVARGGASVDTGRIKVGSYVADHTKTGIGTLMPTGATVGVGANVFGGGLIPKATPSFVWAGPDSAREHRLDKMLSTAAMAVGRRRSLLERAGRPGGLTEAQRVLLRDVFARTAESRARFLGAGA